jgi:hypothetical protein
VTNLKQVLKKKVIYYILSVTLVFVFIFYFAYSFKIGRVVCESQYGFCNAEIARYLSSFEGKGYFNSKKEINKFLASQVIVKEKSFQFKFPNILLINLLERKPLYAVRESDNKFDLISGDGIVVGFSDSTSLPYLSMTEEKFEMGISLDQNQTFALKLLKYLDKLYSVKSGINKEGRSEFKIQDGPMVIFPNEGDSEILIGALRLIIQNITQKTWEYSLEKAYNQITIDLRYKNPIIR